MPPSHAHAAQFYGLQAGTLAALWLLVWATSGQDFFRHALKCNVVLRPTLVPRRVMLFLHRRAVYLPLCYGLIPLLTLAALSPESLPLRVSVALAASAFQLTESSATTSHRDYLMVYNSWALAVLPASLAEGFALGACVHFIASSGFAKLIIGGRDWLKPGTLRSVLRTYGKLSLQDGGPGIPSMNRLVCDHDILLAGSALLTIVFECVVAPLGLLMPPWARMSLLAGMVVLHVGIFALQSAVVGVFFLPNVASYVFGFGADVRAGSSAWVCAVSVCAASAGAVALRRRLLPENWPLTPLALFGWSGRQWDALHDAFVLGRERLVLAPDRGDPVGRPIAGRSMRVAEDAGADAVYDAWNLCLGDTSVHNDILEALDFEVVGKDGWDASGAVRGMEAWLRRGRMIELRTGRPMSCAYYVREVAGADGCSGTVGAVLARGAPPGRERLLGNEPA